MISILNTLPRPAIIAHRGSSAYTVENTLPSFLLAIEQSADAIELDVQLTADKQVVVFHDAFVDRLTLGKGRVSNLSLPALRELAFRASPAAKSHEFRIPTLQDVFDAVGSRIFFNIELKNFGFPNKDLPERVIDIITTYNLVSHTLISSFNPVMLRYVNRTHTPIPTGLLIKYIYHIPWVGKIYSALVDHQSIHLPFGAISPRVIKEQHQSGKVVFTYTLNDPVQIRQAASWGVDGIFTDDPPAARTILDRED